jgi:ankyrin repeat protein
MNSTTTLQLEENGNAEDKYGMTPVCRCIKSGNKDLVLAYIKRGVDMNYQNTVDGVTAFIRACNSENIDMVKFLLDHVDKLDVNLPDGRGYSALYY